MRTIKYGGLAKFMGFAALCFLGLGRIQAQTDADLLRYSMLNPVGTARYNAMGGAFGASLLGLPVACSSDGIVQAGAGAR